MPSTISLTSCLAAMALSSSTSAFTVPFSNAPASDLDLRSSSSSSSSSNPTLRIMPLGASITYGLESSDGNGYRAYLQSLLEADDYPVDYVGSRKNGTMSENASEGWEGLRIDEVLDKARKSVPDTLPNLILINAGANDCFQRNGDGDPDQAGEQMREMLGYLWLESPKATLVLSTLVVNRLEGDDDCMEDINDQFVSLVKEQRARDKKVVLADMRGDGAPALKDLADNTHPNDKGYEKMAEVWYEAIQEAADEGWLESPQDPDEKSDDADDDDTGSGNAGPGSGNSDDEDSDDNDTDSSNGDDEDDIVDDDGGDDVEGDEGESEDQDSSGSINRPWIFGAVRVLRLAMGGSTRR